MTQLIKGWLTSEEAAEILGISPKNITRILGADRIKRQKVGARYMYNEADVRHVAAWRQSPDGKAQITEKKQGGGKATAARVGIRLNDDRPTVPAAQLERNRRKIEQIQRKRKKAVYLPGDVVSGGAWSWAASVGK